MPGPRNDLPEVRLALSNEALKINGTANRSASRRRVSAMLKVKSCDSITHGPAIQSSGRPGPHFTFPIGTAGAVGMLTLLGSAKDPERALQQKNPTAPAELNKAKSPPLTATRDGRSGLGR